jgi:Fe-coproporphyrin III synthase
LSGAVEDVGRRQGTLMVHLLGRCNLQCQHCYMHGSPTRRERLPLHALIDAIEESEALGVGTLYLTGGEPLMYPRLAEVLAAADAIPGLEITVCTNGTLLNERHAELLRASHAKANISIDGDEEFHDRFRAVKGALRRSERGIGMLVDAGTNVTIVSTISRGNLHMLEALADWSATAGATRFRVQPLLHLGRAVELSDQHLTSAELNNLILRLTDLRSRYDGKLDCGLIGVTRRYLNAHPCAAYVCNGQGCHRRMEKEIKKLVIREDGAILPEVTNLSHAFALGHLGDAPLTQLVARYFEAGYEHFDQLCRTTYADILPTWEAAVVPWDQIIADRSYTWRAPDRPSTTVPSTGCGARGCSTESTASRSARQSAASDTETLTVLSA